MPGQITPAPLELQLLTQQGGRVRHGCNAAEQRQQLDQGRVGRVSPPRGDGDHVGRLEGADEGKVLDEEGGGHVSAGHAQVLEKHAVLPGPGGTKVRTMILAHIEREPTKPNFLLTPPTDPASLPYNLIQPVNHDGRE